MAALLRNHPVSATAYAVPLIVLAALYVMRLDALATMGEAVYALGGILAVAVALVAGGLAWQRFREERRDAYLLAGAGMWVVAALHFYHFAAFAGVFGPTDSGLTAAAVLRGALLPTLFFSLFLGLSLLAGRHDRPSTAQPGGVYLAAATLAFIVTVASLIFPVPPEDGIVRVLGQPFVGLPAQPEFLLAVALTLAGIVGILRKDTWRADPLSRWLLLALILTLAVLACIPFVYGWEIAELLLVAQVLTLASYGCVIAGALYKTAGAKPGAAVAAAAAGPVKTPARTETPPTPDKEKLPATPAELALRDLHASHRALRNATDGLLIGLRADGTITDWKPAADFGPTAMPSDLMGEDVRTVLPTDQAEAIMNTVAAAIREGRTEQLRYTAPDGSMALGGYVTPQDADTVLCIVRDQTEHIRTEQELHDARQAADSLRRVTGDWLIRMTRAGAIQDLKPPDAPEFAAFSDMFAGKHLQDVFQGDDVAPLVAAAEAALTDNTVQVLSFLRHSGQVLTVRVARYADDSVLCLLRDITELQETTARLEESQEENQELRGHLERLNDEQATALASAEAAVRVLQSLLPDLILRLRSDGTILECKPAESFGPRNEEKLVGAKVREVLSVDLSSQIMAASERLQSSGVPQRFTCHPVGGQVLGGGLATLIDDQLLCVVRDLTQQKQMETALAQQAAVLAQEMQARLEEESLRSLRGENDILRKQLQRVAQLALEGSGGRAPGEAREDSDSADDAGSADIETARVSREDTRPEIAESTRPGEAPTRPQKSTGPSSLPPPPASLQFSGTAASTPELPRNVENSTDGNSPQRNAADGTDASPRNSADREAAAETSMQTQTAIATQERAATTPDMTVESREESKATSNGEPAAAERTSLRREHGLK